MEKEEVIKILKKGKLWSLKGGEISEQINKDRN